MTLFAKLVELISRIKKLPKRWRAWLAGASAFLLLVFLFPFKSTVAPRWRLNVVDPSGVLGRPNILVTEHWQHYLLESEGHEDVVRTNVDGLVDFPERTIRASLARRLWGVVANFTSQGFNGRYGPYASVVVWGNENYETAVAVYRPDAPLPAELVVHRLP